MMILQEWKQYIRLSRNQIKWIAVVTMLLDHIGYLFFSGREEYHILYLVLRIIGRISFPLFCYLLVQGFLTTKNVEKYQIRLFVFAVIAEIPYDFFKYGKLIFLGDQNVLFTLGVSLTVLLLLQNIEEDEAPYYKILRIILTVLCGMAVTYVLRSDYSFQGVLFTAVMYLWRKDSITQNVILCLLMVTGGMLSPWQILALLILYFCTDTVIYSEREQTEFHLERKVYHSLTTQIKKYWMYCIYPLQFILLKVLDIII